MAQPIDGATCHAASLDILGFRELLAKHGKHLVQVYRTLLGMTKLAGSLQLEVQVADATTGKGLGPLKLGFRKLRAPVIFSDSIFLLSEDASPESLAEICLYSNTIFRKALQMGIPLRGAIAAGATWYFPDERVTLGDSIVRAHALEQQLECIGVVLDPTLGSTPAAGPEIEVATKTGLRRLRPALGKMAAHPSYLPFGVPVAGWREIVALMERAAPNSSKNKYENSNALMEFMLRD